MYRVLIIEDMKDTLAELHDLIDSALSGILGDALPLPQIDLAENVREARERIEMAAQENWNYDAVVLDFKLPADKGENPESDESLCLIIRQKMPDALIAHITSHPEDGEVRAHMQKIHKEQVGYSAIDISKLNITWPELLLDRMKKFLFGERIQKRLSVLFQSVDSSAINIARSRARSAGGLTHELATLAREISIFWPDLDEKTRDQVRQRYIVEQGENGVKVGML